MNEDLRKEFCGDPDRENLKRRSLLRNQAGKAETRVVSVSFLIISPTAEVADAEGEPGFSNLLPPEIVRVDDR